jgi:mannitol-1-phosphate/altronate dehydrogenase
MPCDNAQRNSEVTGKCIVHFANEFRKAMKRTYYNFVLMHQ